MNHGSMNHPTEEQLLWHCYGEESRNKEGGEVPEHLATCEVCQARMRSLQQSLTAISEQEPPDPGLGFEARMWSRIQPQLAPHNRGWRSFVWWQWTAAAVACASLMVAAFLAGRHYPNTAKPAPVIAVDRDGGERVLLIAVGDYLERSQRVLVELANASPNGPLDISTEQQLAEDLVTENRLYRQTADRTGDAAVAGVLDELERVLLDVTHAPSEIPPAELENLRRRLEAEGILFKIRVLGSQVREADTPAGAKDSGRSKS